MSSEMAIVSSPGGARTTGARMPALLAAEAAAATLASMTATGIEEQQAAAFGLGEALVAGSVSSHARLVRFGARVSQDDGADVPFTSTDRR